jgi:hypothetical protein
MNDLTGTIPSAIGLLTDLIVLELGQNQIRGALPFALGNLESLSKYDRLHLAVKSTLQSGSISHSFLHTIVLYSRDAGSRREPDYGYDSTRVRWDDQYRIVCLRVESTERDNSCRGWRVVSVVLFECSPE